MNLTAISRYISLILRHKPEVIGITLDEHGWADVDALIQGIRETKEPAFSRELLDEIVRTDSKQRYAYNEEHTLIRASQGHSIPVDVELTQAMPPELLWHGTGEKYTASIEKTGLIPKSRLYVHLSKDMDTAIAVGKRHGKPVVYQVATGRMARAGYVFYLSANGVWLTKEVPVDFFKDFRRTHKQLSKNAGVSTLLPHLLLPICYDSDRLQNNPSESAIRSRSRHIRSDG